MKTKLLLASFFVTCLFTACNNDEPENPSWIDSQFAIALQEKGYIKNAKTVTPAEVRGITSLNVFCCYTGSLKGIEYFTSLKELNCGNNNLTQLDVSNNT